VWPVVAGLLGVAITAAVTAYLGKRGKSGRIETSEAKDLWDTLRAELARISAEATALRAEVVVAQLEMTALREETAKVRVHIIELETKLATFADLEIRLAACNLQEKKLRAALKRAGVTP
jgi:predicted  nucleic acid-binding Zn-ribbon protein